MSPHISTQQNSPERWRAHFDTTNREGALRTLHFNSFNRLTFVFL
jgi:hypothetical protein